MKTLVVGKRIFSLCRNQGESRGASRAVSDPAKNLSEMAENSNISFRENHKLKGSSNYYVWALKMRAVLRGEG